MSYISKFSVTENYSVILDVPFDQSFTFRNLGVLPSFLFFLAPYFLLFTGDRIFFYLGI